MNRHLTREITRGEVEAYNRDGVVHLPGILDQEWVERIHVAVDRVLDAPGHRGMDMNTESSPGRFAFDIFMWVRDPDFRALAFESPLAEMAAKGMGSPTANFMWDFLIYMSVLIYVRAEGKQCLRVQPDITCAA